MIARDVTFFARNVIFCYHDLGADRYQDGKMEWLVGGKNWRVAARKRDICWKLFRKYKLKDDCCVIGDDSLEQKLAI